MIDCFENQFFTSTMNVFDYHKEKRVEEEAQIWKCEHYNMSSPVVEVPWKNQSTIWSTSFSVRARARTYTNVGR